MQWEDGGKLTYLVEGSEPVWRPIPDATEKSATAEGKK